MVLGSRLKGQREEGAMSRLNMVGNHLLALLANILYGTRISDPCTGYWGFRGEVPKSLKLDAVGFELEANLHKPSSVVRDEAELLHFHPEYIVHLDPL